MMMTDVATVIDGSIEPSHVQLEYSEPLDKLACDVHHTSGRFRVVVWLYGDEVDDLIVSYYPTQAPYARRYRQLTCERDTYGAVAAGVCNELLQLRHGVNVDTTFKHYQPQGWLHGSYLANSRDGDR